MPPNYVGFLHVGMWCRCGAVGEDGDEQVKMLTMQMRLWSCNRVNFKLHRYLDLFTLRYTYILRASYISYTTITLKYEPHII